MSNTRPPLRRQNATVGNFFAAKKSEGLSIQHKNLIAIANNLKGQSHVNIQYGEYCILQTGCYINFISKEAAPHPLVGWKLHVNVANEDLEASWPLITSMLIKRNIRSFKLRRIYDVEKEVDPYAPRKQLTIYCSKHPEYSKEDWQDLIYLLEKGLLDSGISPGELAPANKTIDGSLYFSYRNDQHPLSSRRYIGDDDAVNYTRNRTGFFDYNPARSRDPFKDIKIELNKEPATDISFKR